MVVMALRRQPSMMQQGSGRLTISLPTIASFPTRYSAFALCVAGLAASLAVVLAAPHFWVAWIALAVFGVLSGTGVHDLRQSRHAILRNYPVIGHLRFLLEYIRPEMRQYFIESDSEAAPFSRAQRSLVYQRSKGEPDNRPFGTQMNVTIAGYEWINHSMQPTRLADHDFRIVIGGSSNPASPAGQVCTQPYNASVFNISAMSFGALSANAILALNQGAKLGGFAHDTGEGSISAHHRAHGGDLDLGDRLRLLRLPRRGRQLQRRTLRRQRARSAGQDDRDQAEPGRQARPRRRAAGAQGHGRDRGRARRAGGRGLHFAVLAQRLLDAGRR